MPRRTPIRRDSSWTLGEASSGLAVRHSRVGTDAPPATRCACQPCSQPQHGQGDTPQGHPQLGHGPLAISFTSSRTNELNVAGPGLILPDRV